MFGFFRRKTKVGSPTDEDIIQGYGRVLEQRQGGITDERALPFPKAVIKDALVRWIPNVSGDMRGHMENALVLLAQFQPNVGNTRYPGGLTPDVLQTAQAVDAQEAARMVIAAARDDTSAPDELVARVAAEERELIAILKSMRR
jgi:hypothetical protein